MADILSQEEIDALLEPLDDDGYYDYCNQNHAYMQKSTGKLYTFVSFKDVTFKDNITFDITVEYTIRIAMLKEYSPDKFKVSKDLIICTGVQFDNDFERVKLENQEAE